MSDPEIVALYVQGADSQTIALRANCDATTVLDIVRAAGGTVRRRGGVPVELALSDDEICRLYRLGLSGAQIADKAHCVVSTVYNVLRRNGVRRRPRGDSARAKLAARNARKRTGPPGMTPQTFDIQIKSILAALEHLHTIDLAELADEAARHGTPDQRGLIDALRRCLPTLPQPKL